MKEVNPQETTRAYAFEMWLASIFVTILVDGIATCIFISSDYLGLIY